MRKQIDKSNNCRRSAQKGPISNWNLRKLTGKSGNKHFSFGYSGILVSISAIFLAAQIFLANSLAVQGNEIRNLEILKGDLQKDMSSLNQKSAQLSSLDSIRLLAKEKLGMVESFDSFDYFGSSVALR